MVNKFSKTPNGLEIANKVDEVIDALPTIDSSLSSSSENPVQNKVVKSALDDKQDELVSGTNIKTINNQSVLGSGNIVIQAEGVVDQTYDATSTNAQSGVAVSQAIATANDIAWVTYSSTSFDDVVSAYNSGKIVCCIYLNRIYTLTVINASQYYAYFDATYCTSATDATANGLSCTKSGNTTTWRNYYKTLQTKGLVTTIDSTSTDTTYPSAKATYNKINESLSEKQDKLLVGNNISITNVIDASNVIFGVATSLDTTADFVSIDYCNNRFLALSEWGGFMSSLDGNTWTTYYYDDKLIYTQWSDLSYMNGVYVLLGSEGYISTSSDGETWTQPSNVLSNYYWKGICNNGSKFVAIGRTGYISESSDGVNWSSPTLVSNFANKLWSKVCYGNNEFVAIGENGYISTSSDGSTWSTATSKLQGSYWNDIVYNGTYYIALHDDGYIALSTDADTWTEAISQSGMTGGLWYGLACDLTTHKVVAISYYARVSVTKSSPVISATVPAQVQANWNETNTSSNAYIQNKPNLSTVATSGSYNDLSNKPTIPAAQVNSDWNASSGVAQILNKPTIPTVPNTLSSFTDDLGTSPTHTHSQYLTSHQDISGKANTDLSNCTKPYVTSTYHSGSSWYRVWSDGFIEQGGYISTGTASDNRQISLNKTMSSSTYFVICSTNVAVTGTSNTSNRAVCRTFGRIVSRATNSFNMQCDAGDFYWYACGY